VDGAQVIKWLGEVDSRLLEDRRSPRFVGLGLARPVAGLDGAALCSLSRAEWLGLSAQLFSATEAQAAVVWDALAPAAALAASNPAAEVAFLPPPTEEPPFTAVVAGGTGAGKSTLINALLGFELLPTSCMRACAAGTFWRVIIISPGHVSESIGILSLARYNHISESIGILSPGIEDGGLYLAVRRVPLSTAGTFWRFGAFHRARRALSPGARPQSSRWSGRAAAGRRTRRRCSSPRP